MQKSGRKRVVSSCIPCYTRKQKCNRRYPCNHCARRRRPEECAYYNSQALQANISPVQTEARQNEDVPTAHDTRIQQNCSSGSAQSITDQESRIDVADSIAEVFGYFEESESNTMAVVCGLGLRNHQIRDRQCAPIPLESLEEVEDQTERMPDRQILDFLVQYYVMEIHWMEQLVHPPWFLAQYQVWWNSERPSSTLDVEFAVLLLRMCSHALQFLPSPSYTIDKIRGMSLTDIRDSINDVADKLTAICIRLDGKGSLLRVQHLLFSGLRYQCEGRNKMFWEAFGDAVRVAHRIGLDRRPAATITGMNELDKEMRRRVYCNLFIWDSLFSRQLDMSPFLPSGLTDENLPRMHLSPNVDDADAPEEFSERLIQARLASFWRDFLPRREYDATVAEATYEKFCNGFLATLPPAFALDSSTQWDERLPMLPLQRQNLHTTIFESLCCNFRPVLLQNPACLNRLPVYKRVLLSCQRRALAVAALRVLESVSKLHTILGGCHTRFVGIIFPTFEAAVLLVGLCTDIDFPGKSEDGPLTTLRIDPLGTGKARVSRDQCLRAVDDALARLRMLAEVSNMAQVGAQTLTQLLSKMPRQQTPDMETIPAWINQMLELGVEEAVGQCDFKDIPNSECGPWIQQVSEELI
ncbi:putative transcription factor sol4 [Colletotrichum gloeosporioides]|uniref:Putative transcription factor sol4 n=1 Tax=Colletotrichum gloeosporioides TaxID=474922 RepID=A0A8H4FPB2_COLGL|nr:putative transcription factor sol4 [Colletotrichum gloeosporioides]KAF3809598.1 putative transcription factor sol4 [Colletotrichum gloeosporioides]